MERVVAVVPARMASTRFPNKPLAPILGLPLVEHVRRRASLVDGIDEVIVATCDKSIAEVVRAAGGSAVMTADTHERCTTRVEEAVRGRDGLIVVIVQGDEPLLSLEAMRAVVAPLQDPAVGCTNVLAPIESDDDLANADVVKAVLDQQGDLLYLTRASVPHFIHRGSVPVYRQTGLMAMRSDVLRRFVDLPETPLERAESVDMLRLLEHGVRVRGVPLPYRSYGVDRPRDVDIVERILRDDPEQAALYRRIAWA